MSDNLIERVAPHIAAPVTRQPLHGAGEAAGGTEPNNLTLGPVTVLFADDDAE